MIWGTPLSKGIWAWGSGPRSGDDSLFIKNRSSPDFGPGLPVRPTKRESVRARPEPGPSVLIRIHEIHQNALAVGSELRPEGPSSGPRPRKPGICYTKCIRRFLAELAKNRGFSKTPLAVGSGAWPDSGPSAATPARGHETLEFAARNALGVFS